MVITRKKVSESTKIPVLVSKAQLKTWLVDSTKSATKQIAIKPQNFSATAAHRTTSNNRKHQFSAQQGQTLEYLVSQLAEEELTAILKLAGKQAKNSSFDEVLRMLQGEGSVIDELCSVGILPSFPCDVKSPRTRSTIGESPITVALTDLESSANSKQEEDSYGISEISCSNLFEHRNMVTQVKSLSPGALSLKSSYDEFIIDLINTAGINRCVGERKCTKAKFKHGLLLKSGGEEIRNGDIKRPRRQ